MCAVLPSRPPRAALGRGLTPALSREPQSSLAQAKKQARLPPLPPSHPFFFSVVPLDGCRLGSWLLGRDAAKPGVRALKRLTMGDAEMGVKQNPDMC